MTKIDQFESVFKAAAKPVFRYEEVPIASVLVVTDLDEEGARSFGEKIRGFLSVLGDTEKIAWRDVGGKEFRTVDDALRLVEEQEPDLICTYRTLHSDAWKWPHSLGEHLDVLTQLAKAPVLVVPHPASGDVLDSALHNTDFVMAMTDHLTGDHRLVNYALRFTMPKGTLHLVNIEDRRTLRRYMEAISKIPSIDTEMAEESITARLLKEAADYIASCRRACEERAIEVNLQETVILGEHLVEYKRLVAEKAADLLVLNTKEEDQLAMHGLAYPLAVELNYVPLLML